MNKLVVVTGPPGSGKTVRLWELQDQGFKTVDEVGTLQQIADAITDNPGRNIAVSVRAGSSLSVVLESTVAKSEAKKEEQND